jgi:hypothetical protein
MRKLSHGQKPAVHRLAIGAQDTILPHQKPAATPPALSVDPYEA